MSANVVTWVDIINQRLRETLAIIVGRCGRRLDVKSPQIRLRVLTKTTGQRQTGQQQRFLLVRHGTEGGDVDSHGVDADE